MPAGFPKYTTGHPEDAAYTSNKVIVARSYVRLLAAGSNPANNAVDDEPDRDRSRSAANAFGREPSARTALTRPGCTASR